MTALIKIYRRVSSEKSALCVNKVLEIVKQVIFYVKRKGGFQSVFYI